MSKLKTFNLIPIKEKEDRSVFMTPINPKPKKQGLNIEIENRKESGFRF